MNALSETTAMNASRDTLTSEDATHLQVLAIFYYVFAGLGALSVLMIAVFGAVFLGMAGLGEHGQPMPADARVVVIAMFALITALNALATVLHFMTGQRLRQRRGRTFCQIVAGITCLSLPFGTVLGVFTFIVLSRPTVTAAFRD